MTAGWRLPMMGWHDCPTKVMSGLHQNPNYRQIAPDFARRSVKLATGWSSRVLLDFENWITWSQNFAGVFDQAATFADWRWNWCSGSD
jgi:hypothetical protein